MRLLSGLRRFRSSERGQVLAFVVAIMVVLFGFLALALDVGAWYLDRRLAQNQVDAAALAAVQELPDVDRAVVVALDYLANNNAGGSSSCDVMPLPPGFDLVVSGVAFQDSDSDGEHDRVRVCIQREGRIFFSALLGLADIQVGAVASAGIEYDPASFALMAMNRTECGTMFFTRNVRINIGDTPGPLGEGSSYTRSSCETAFLVNGSGSGFRIETDDGEHYVVGGAACLGSDPIDECVYPPPTIGWTRVILEDPWRFEDIPDTGEPSECIEFDYQNPRPEIYCSLVVDNSTGDVELRGGTYVFKGDVTVSGRRLSSSEDVLIYMTCMPSPCDDGGAVSRLAVEGNGDLVLGGGGDLHDIDIWVDGGPSASCSSSNSARVSFTGRGDVEIEGGIYAISSTVDFGGQSRTWNLGGSIVADRICFRGDTRVNIDSNLIVPDVPVAESLIE